MRGEGVLPWHQEVPRVTGVPTGLTEAAPSPRPPEEPPAEEDVQQLSVQVEPACSVEIVEPTEAAAG